MGRIQPPARRLLPSTAVSLEAPPPPPPPPPPAGPPPQTAASLPGLVKLFAAAYGVVTLFAIGYAVFDHIQRGTGGPTGTEPFLGLAVPPLGTTVAGLAVGLVIVGVVHVGLRVLNSIEAAAEVLAGFLGPLTLKQALYMALFSAVGEELLFRGALWPHLGLLGTTFLFGVVHFIPNRRLWGYPLFALVAGLMLGLLRDAGGSVFPPMLAHFVINALNLWWLGANHARLTGGAAPSPATHA